MAGSWKHMNYSQFKLGKEKEEEGMTRKHPSRKWSSLCRGGSRSSLTRGLKPDMAGGEAPCPLRQVSKNTWQDWGSSLVLGFLPLTASKQQPCTHDWLSESILVQVHCCPVITKEEGTSDWGGGLEGKQGSGEGGEGGGCVTLWEALFHLLVVCECVRGMWS